MLATGHGLRVELNQTRMIRISQTPKAHFIENGYQHERDGTVDKSTVVLPEDLGLIPSIYI